ncbi:hypothetical protein EVAR_31270_1 [Eumeta japonica]|uniref:Uncharacterized protein n=1 Tax=Eumeta variegata TaxID=151549 RepID=A0A4C1VTK8_EUMVA|nr:hypothetical protein EVAR_31270_1 [Eumeta japonica]
MSCCKLKIKENTEAAEKVGDSVRCGREVRVSPAGQFTIGATALLTAIPKSRHHRPILKTSHGQSASQDDSDKPKQGMHMLCSSSVNVPASSSDPENRS